MDEAERARIREMGGSDTALVNLLEGTVETGKIHPVGDRTTGLAVQNLTKVALDFMDKMGRQGDADLLEKLTYWLHQGAGHFCDACKYTMEEAHRRVLKIAQEKIQSNDKTGRRERDFEGGRGHELTIDDKIKTEVESICESQQFAHANLDARKWCQMTMKGRHKATVFSALTQGTFGFQDFDRILQNDRRDIDVGSLGVKAHKKTVSAADRQFRGRHHVWQKSQELCTTVQQRHPAKAASVIQEVCEEVVEEHESQVVRAFVEGGHGEPGASAQKVCVEIAEKCEEDEFEAIRKELV